jgi:hypothetical protein
MHTNLIRRTSLALVFVSASALAGETSPLPDYAIPGPWQDKATVDWTYDSLQAVPAFREPAPDHPVPMGEDIRWCHHVKAAKELMLACMNDALDPAICDQARAVMDTDKAWRDALHDRDVHASDAELSCRS